MIKLGGAVAALVVSAAMQTQAVGSFSSPSSINTSVRENRYWEMLRTNEVDVAWRWLTNATRAELTIAGMNGTVLTTNVTSSVSNVLWQAFASSVPRDENTYDLTLVFYGSGESVVGAQTSHVAVVKGAFGSVPVDLGPSSRTWSAVWGNVVIPYDVRWTNALATMTTGQLVIESVGGSTQTYSLDNSSGYWGWRLRGSDWGYGPFNLTLSFADVAATWIAQVVRYAEGSVFLMR